MKTGLEKRKVLFFVFASACVTALLAEGSSFGLTLDKVLATVDNEVITFSDYQWFARSEDNRGKADKVDERTFRKLIEEKVILHEALRRGVEASDGEVDRLIDDLKKNNALSQEELEKELSRDGMGIHRYRKFMKNKIIISKLVGEDVDSKVIVTDKEIEEFYTANKRNYPSSPDEVEVGALFLRLQGDATVTEITDLKRKVLRISSQLKENDNFETLLDQYSHDDSKDREGRLGVFKRGALIPPLDKKVFSMKKGEISDPIWVREGVYILKLINKSEETFRRMEEVREEIYIVLYNKKKERLFHEWMRGLWEKASITLN